MYEDAASSQHIAPEALDQYAWEKEARLNMKQAVEEETTKMFWNASLESLSKGLAADSEKIAQPHPHLVLSDVCKAVLRAGVEAAKGVPGDASYRVSFKRAWPIARDPAREAARTAIQNSSNEQNDPERRAMWDSAWDTATWEKCWNEAGELAQPEVVELGEYMIREIVAKGGEAMAQAQAECRTILVRMPEGDKKLSSEYRSVTVAKLQEELQRSIWGNTTYKLTREAVITAISAIWKEARERIENPAVAR